MSREQIVLLIYHELRHVDPEDDGLKKHDFESWRNVIRTEKQISIFDNNVIPMERAK